MNAPKISVIIPMYNAEKFIRQCLISVLASKFADYEVLVVDDCSTDNSVAEVEKLAPHFGGRLKIFHTEKNSGGAGIPRNVGIKNSAGKYVMFIDNDDALLPTALDDFFTAAEEFQADVVHTVKAFVFYGMDEKNFARADLQLQSDSSDDFSTTPRLETENLRERMKDFVDEKIFWLPWGKFFRREFLIENKIEFPNLTYSEDMIFCFKCVCLAKKYLRVPFAANIHRIRRRSLSQKIIPVNEGVQFFLNVITNVAALTDEFMCRQEFFRVNPDVRRDVLKFFIDKHFSFIDVASNDFKAHEVQKKFYEALENPALNQHGKNLVAAYLFTERALNK